MADNFNLRQFLTENKLTKNAQILKEEVSFNGKPVDTRSIEIDGIDMNDYPDFVDAYITYAEYEDGTPLTDQELHDFEAENYGLVGELIHDRQLYLQEKKEEVPENPEDYTKQPGYIHETLTPKERKLIKLVENALGIQPSDDDEIDFNPADAADERDYRRDQYRGNQMEEKDQYGYDPDNEEWEDSEPFTGNYVGRRDIEEGDEMANEKVLPKYENIEKLMQEIEHGTNEAAYKHKMAKMKEVAEMLEAKVGSLEEGEGADFVDAKKVKQMKKDIMTLRKQAEKLEKEYEKKFAKKEDKKEEK
jgi:hypothetical protein